MPMLDMHNSHALPVHETYQGYLEGRQSKVSPPSRAYTFTIRPCTEETVAPKAITVG
jgi:hypothetical protein